MVDRPSRSLPSDAMSQPGRSEEEVDRAPDVIDATGAVDVTDAETTGPVVVPRVNGHSAGSIGGRLSPGLLGSSPERVRPAGEPTEDQSEVPTDRRLRPVDPDVPAPRPSRSPRPAPDREADTEVIPRVRATPPERRRRADERAEGVSRPRSHRAPPTRGGPRHGRHRRAARKQPLWRELLTLLGVALLLTFLIQQFVGRVYSIPSGSMEQTLHGCPGCTGDRVFVDKVVYRFHDPEPGDVVVFQGPNSWTENDVPTTAGNPLLDGLRQVGSLIGVAPPDERDFVKRVIAVGGQTVQCCDDRDRVQVDGEPLDEPYVYWENGGPDERQRFEPVTVPEGTLWVMGDNRGNSSDSRFQGGGGIRGVVPLGKVIGKVRAIVLPPSRWRGVGDHDPNGPPDATAAGWQRGIPAGIGLAAAWPVLWLGRRAGNALTRKAD